MSVLERIESIKRKIKVSQLSLVTNRENIDAVELQMTHALRLLHELEQDLLKANVIVFDDFPK